MADASFTPFERLAAHFLGRFPAIKSVAKRVYARVNSVLFRPPSACRVNVPFRLMSKVGEQAFFGYYDKSPELDGNYVYHCFESGSAMGKHDRVQLLVRRAQDQQLIAEASSRAYSLQQGSRAHWFDGNTIIFNDLEADGTPVARRWELNSQNVTAIGPAFADTHSKNLGIVMDCYGISAVDKDYAYRVGKPQVLDRQRHGFNVTRVDLVSGQHTQLFSTQDLLGGAPPLPNVEGDAVSHVMISRSGRWFMFIHRLLVAGRRYDRLYVASTDAGQPRLLVDSGMVSHCCWLSDGVIFGFWRDAARGPGFFTMTVDDHESAKLAFHFGQLAGKSDGHPSARYPWIVFDSYPNRRRMQALWLTNAQNGSLQLLGEFHSPVRYHGALRCDLHPRFTADGKRVWIDSTHAGARGLYCLDVEAMVS